MSNDGQLQPEDSLVDRGVDDVLDEGISPPERLRGSIAKGVTAEEQREGESLEERLAQEVPDDTGITPTDARDPDTDAGELDDPSDTFAGEERSGRLVAPDEGTDVDDVQQQVAGDVGIDGAGASAEEAAVHTWSEEQLDALEGETDDEIRPDTA
ncbi:DUF5709 domain-containing protein [Aeromicrobium sp. Leaf350]|uniref:DUF5709 domain-containing protein n=1 Tax=Aeromicrobium sp. Leaf350 TaxID=2876565 RepID=UPI001E35C72B|nr:DUF5709 domain-containing protein [Aeromicrobium sp. Leaf350]